MKKLCCLVFAILSIGQLFSQIPFRGNSGKYGYKDESGRVVIPCKYYEAKAFSDGIAQVALNGKYGFIDTSGNVVIPFKYKRGLIYGFTEGLFGCSEKGKKWGYIDKTGRTIIDFQYIMVTPFSEGVAAVFTDKECYFIDKTGKRAIHTNEKLVYAEMFHDGLCIVGIQAQQYSSSLRYGLIDHSGAWVVEPQYEEIFTDRLDSPFNDGLAKVCLAGKIGYIDKNGVWYEDNSKTNAFSSNIADKQPAIINNNQGGIIQAKEKSTWTDFVENFVHNEINHQRKVYTNHNKVSSSNETGLPIRRRAYGSIATSYRQPHYDHSDLSDDIRGASQEILSDVDENIPSTFTIAENTFAVIIANEVYRREAAVEYATADGAMFKTYCTQVLGIPQGNIHHLTDATLNDIRAEVRWITNVAKAYNGEAKIIFYYAGHGIPDESSRSAYLLPIDGYGADVQSGYKLSDLYAQLSMCPTRSTVVLLDACFSGSQRGSQMLASSRGVALKVKSEEPTGNMVVISAASGEETAYPYREKGHGMFTYFLLKKLQETRGVVTLGELSDYIITNVTRRSIVDNGKSQTPTVTPSQKLSSSWRTLQMQ